MLSSCSAGFLNTVIFLASTPCRSDSLSQEQTELGLGSLNMKGYLSDLYIRDQVEYIWETTSTPINSRAWYSGGKWMENILLEGDESDPHSHGLP